MIRLGGKNILLGGFRDHWARPDMVNPSLFLASLHYCHYDFMTLQDLNRPTLEAAAGLSDRIKLYSGKEEFYGWGHVVTIDGRKPAHPSSEADFRKVLSELNEFCDFLFLTHPTYHETWDPHLLLSDRDIPDVLYGKNKNPKKHTDTTGSDRTILFAEENSLPIIQDAVRIGLSLIEDLSTGELVDTAPLVTFLNDHAYREEIQRLDEKRDRFHFGVRAKWTAGVEVEAIATESVDLGLAESFTKAKTPSVAAGNPQALGKAPVLFERDHFYLSVVFRSGDIERIWAVDAEHPIRFDIHPKFEAGQAFVEIIPLSSC